MFLINHRAVANCQPLNSCAEVSHTCAVLFVHREFRNMDRDDRIRACYLHACLRYVQRNLMTNTTIRKRFRIEEKNSSITSRIIKDTIEAGLIRCHDETVGSRARKYLPFLVCLTGL